MPVLDIRRACWRRSTRSGGGNCVEVAWLWRKSSRSGDANGGGGACVEVSPAWHKSCRSGSSGGACVEAAPHGGLTAVRDSKNPDGPILSFSPGAFSSFLHHIRAGRLDLH
ncbi:DUF397 domain-containing protein [Longimycelium tulufanense]|uniref:DUF397 domain-containing protein n=1 Tax=Longimycelium tulufanense TaxID=907463 RepID=UPI00166EF78B|nr:DUF397 domain-containing protein [Longimycelium tulufanense]